MAGFASRGPSAGVMAGLDPIFAPRTIAVLGVSRNPAKLGHRLLQNVKESGFPGTVYPVAELGDRKSTRLNSSHGYISYAVFCLKKKNRETKSQTISTGSAQAEGSRR